MILTCMNLHNSTECNFWSNLGYCSDRYFVGQQTVPQLCPLSCGVCIWKILF
jgi:hypothetical protein